MAAPIVAEETGLPPATGNALGRKGIGWAMFEWARNPYYNIIVIYVFAAYFAKFVVGDPVRGQALTGRVIFIAGLIMIPLAPLLGAIVDKAGRKKPFIALTLALLGTCAALLWFVAPGAGYAVPLGMALLVIGYCSYTVSELLHNSMLPGSGAPKSVPMISGLGLALGNAAGIFLLLVVFLMNQTGAFGLDEPTISRLAGPLVAVWLGIFILFFFWLMPDYYRTGNTWRQALRDISGLSESESSASSGNWLIGFFFVKPYQSVIKKFRAFPNVMKYLAARMFWSDALGVIFAVSGVYVAGVLEWSAAEIPLFGIIVSVFAILGGPIGGYLDQRFGPKKALTIEIITIMVIFIIQIGVTKESIMYGLIPANGVIHGAGLFDTLADVFYVGMTIPSAMMIVACISSSRYMLVHIAPPENIGEFFGFYAMVGSITLWIGPLLLDIVTSATQSQRWGMASILLLFLTGLLLLQMVDANKTPNHLRKEIPATFE